jgi:hypothetical protein
MHSFRLSLIICSLFFSSSSQSSSTSTNGRSSSGWFQVVSDLLLSIIFRPFLLLLLVFFYIYKSASSWLILLNSFSFSSPEIPTFIFSNSYIHLSSNSLKLLMISLILACKCQASHRLYLPFDLLYLLSSIQTAISNTRNSLMFSYPSHTHTHIYTYSDHRVLVALPFLVRIKLTIQWNIRLSSVLLLLRCWLDFNNQAYLHDIEYRILE